ncbi:MAG TPA: tetratricopeptide repeat protein [Candidatus Ozemobacteraceae bacterium]|nr:tetratricopeptide repeat protein [Candidatus Ozemobacteraceae bacterium]
MIRSFAEDRTGRLWAGTFGSGLICIDGASGTIVASGTDGLPDSRISKLLVDDDGTLLVATAGGGAVRYAPEAGRCNPLVEGSEPASKHFHAFARLSPGSWLLGAVGEGVFVFRNAAWINLTESDGLPSAWVNDALAGDDGSAWLATWDGIAHMTASATIDRVELPEAGWSDGNVNAIASFAGALWIGTGSGGLVRRDGPVPPSRKPRYRKIAEVPAQVHALTSFEGRLWIATENGLFSIGPEPEAAAVAGGLAEATAVTALGVWKSRLVAGTDLGVIWMRDAGREWKKIFAYYERRTICRRSGSMIGNRGLLALGMALTMSVAVWASPIDERLSAAKALFDQGKFKESAEAYKTILIENKELIKTDHALAGDVWQGFGEALEKGGWKARADDAFKRAADHRALGGDKAASAKPTADVPVAAPDSKLMDKYSLASIKSDKAQELYRRGAAYLEEGRFLYAIQEFVKALEVEPANADLMDIAASAMVAYGEPWFDKAKMLMDEYRKNRGDAAMTHDQWINLGRAATRAKKYDFKVAETALQAALKLSAQSYPAHVAMGELLLLRGEYKKAIEWFEKARKIKDGDLRLLWGIGDAYTGLSDLHKALDFYATALELAPQDPEAVYKYAGGLKNVGRIDEAILYFERAIALDPSKAKYHLGLVDIYLPRTMDFSAKKHLDAALSLEPENPWCHYYNGLFMEMRRRIDDAVMEYSLAAQMGPDMLDVKYQLANIFAAVGNRFPGNNFSCENPSDRLEYLPFKDVKQAYRLYSEILSINPKYRHAQEIQGQIAGIEELLDIDKKLQKSIDSVVR